MDFTVSGIDTVKAEQDGLVAGTGEVMVEEYFRLRQIQHWI